MDVRESLAPRRPPRLTCWCKRRSPWPTAAARVRSRWRKRFQQRTLQDALAGKRTAMREAVKWIQEREAWLAKHAPKASRQMSPIIASPDPHNADDALVLLGIAAPDPARAVRNTDRPHLLLEPWAVQAALSRRRGGQRLTEKECEDIRHRTRDPESLRWPRGTNE
jgi:hypothetical protein